MGLDSVGISVQSGERFIVHEVEAGETLFALSRKYNVDVQSIKAANTESLDNLSIGQRVLIPIQKINNQQNGIVHTVKSSETLFSISRQYDVNVDDLKSWNNLMDNNISVGQQLIINQPSSNPDGQKNNTQAVESKNRKTHTVDTSQTL